MHLLVYCSIQFCWAHIEYVLVNFADQIQKIEKFFCFQIFFVNVTCRVVKYAELSEFHIVVQPN